MSKLGLIGKATLGLAGAGFGAGAGALIDDNPGRGATTGALIGGAAGAMAIPAVTTLGKAGLGIGEKVGEGILGALSSTATYGQENVAANIGSNIIGGLGAAAGGLIAGFGTESKLAMLGSPIQRHTTAIKGFGEKIIKWDADADVIHKVKFTKLGKGIIAGMGLVQGLSGAKDELVKQHMGEIDPYVHTATPQIPAYQMNAGATGDLVFALNANRRG